MPDSSFIAVDAAEVDEHAAEIEQDDVDAGAAQYGPSQQESRQPQPGHL